MDPQAKKVALRAINYGLYVLTAKQGQELAAASINSMPMRMKMACLSRRFPRFPAASLKVKPEPKLPRTSKKQ